MNDNKRNMEKMTGSFVAHPDYYDHIDSFSLLSDQRFGYTLGGGQEIHVNVNGRYQMERLDDQRFKLKIYDIWSYDEDEEEFIYPVNMEREAVVEIRQGLYVFKKPYSIDEERFGWCLHFDDNPFKHCPTMEEAQDPYKESNIRYDDDYFRR